MGTVCLKQDSDHVCLWPDYHLDHDIAKHSVIKESTGEWKGALLSSVMRIGSICEQVMHVHVYGVDQVSNLFWSAFAYVTQALLQASWYGSH